MASMLSTASIICLLIVTATAAIPSYWNMASEGHYGNLSAECAAPVLDQGFCGSCYAFSTATTVGVTLCQYMLQSKPEIAKDAPNLSPQFALDAVFKDDNSSNTCCWRSDEKRFAKTCGANTNSFPCCGGWAFSTMESLAKQSGYATCMYECSQGCMPYKESACIENDVSKGICAIDSECRCEPFSSTSCDGRSTGFHEWPSKLQPYPLCHYYWCDLSDEGVRGRVQEWIMTHGPVSVGMDAGCLALQNYLGECGGPAALYGMYSCLSDTVQFTMNVSSAESGWVRYERDSRFYVRCCPEQQEPLAVYGCNGEPNHAVTLMGWTNVHGKPAWIIQNSWGRHSGDEGFFYVYFDNVGHGEGQITMQDPVGACFSCGNAPSFGKLGAHECPISGGHHAIPASDPYKGIIGHLYAQLISKERGLEHRHVKTHSTSRQVVNGLLYRINATLTDSEDNHMRPKIHRATMHWHPSKGFSLQHWLEVGSFT